MPVTPETGAPVATTPEAVATKSPAQLSAEDLHNSLVDMVDQQKSAKATPDVTVSPTSVARPETVTSDSGKYEAKATELGAAVGSRVDALVDRGSSAVAAGKERVGEKVDGAALKAYELAGKVDSGIKNVKERAANVRERVRNGAEAGAEKTSEAVKAAKEKSHRMLLGAIGLSITAAEGVAEVPEKIKNRGRKIADRLNRWCAKAKESFSGMKDSVRDRVASGFDALDAATVRTAERAVSGGRDFLEGVGKVVEKTVGKIDTVGQNWEARLQEDLRKAEKAKAESLRQSLKEAKKEAKLKEASQNREVAVELARQGHAEGKARLDQKLQAEVLKAEEEYDKAESGVAKLVDAEVDSIPDDKLEQAYAMLATGSLAPTPAADSTPEAAPKVETATVTPITPGSAPIAPEAAA